MEQFSCVETDRGSLLKEVCEALGAVNTNELCHALKKVAKEKRVRIGLLTM